MSDRSGPRTDGHWCCMCGVWKTASNRLERCEVSHAVMQSRYSPSEGLAHLWAFGIFDRAMDIWDRDEYVRARLERQNR